MNTGHVHGGGSAKVPQLRPSNGECEFPECEEPVVTEAGMCERHRRVRVSGTGSWLEAG
jgi:hypothetical protein